LGTAPTVRTTRRPPAAERYSTDPSRPVERPHALSAAGLGPGGAGVVTLGVVDSEECERAIRLLQQSGVTEED